MLLSVFLRRSLLEEEAALSTQTLQDMPLGVKFFLGRFWGMLVMCSAQARDELSTISVFIHKHLLPYVCHNGPSVH
jgi:hypothetical protein